MDVKTALDTLWVLAAAALVFFMNAGFALLEAGLCRAKNSANILGKNVLVFCVATLAYWAVGYALMFAGAESLLVSDKALSPASIPVFAFFLFQACFAATACSIISGAVAERIKYGAFLGVAFLLALIPYPVVGRWVWGGGFLARWGFHDFAGSTVVHAFGGFAALTGVLLLGPRVGRYGKDGRLRPIPGHSMPLATLGTFILWLGWFGFNAGSVLAVDASVPGIALTTILSACAGGSAATLLAWFHFRKPDLTMSLNGILGGLVAITASCAVVHPSARWSSASWRGACSSRTGCCTGGRDAAGRAAHGAEVHRTAGHPGHEGVRHAPAQPGRRAGASPPIPRAGGSAHRWLAPTSGALPRRPGLPLP